MLAFSITAGDRITCTVIVMLLALLMVMPTAQAADDTTSRHNAEFAAEAQTVRELNAASRRWRLARVNEILAVVNAPSYCRNAELLELWPAVPEQCLKAVDEYVFNLQKKYELLRNEIKAEMQIGAGR